MCDSFSYSFEYSSTLFSIKSRILFIVSLDGKFSGFLNSVCLLFIIFSCALEKTEGHESSSTLLNFCISSAFWSSLFIRLGNDPCKHGYSWKWVEGIATQTKIQKIIYSNNRLSIYEWHELEGTRTTLWVEIFLFCVTVEDVSAIFLTANTDEEVDLWSGSHAPMP